MFKEILSRYGCNKSEKGYYYSVVSSIRSCEVNINYMNGTLLVECQAIMFLAPFIYISSSGRYFFSLIGKSFISINCILFNFDRLFYAANNL